MLNLYREISMQNYEYCVITEHQAYEGPDVETIENMDKMGWTLFDITLRSNKHEGSTYYYTFRRGL